MSLICFIVSFIFTKMETHFQNNSYVMEVEAVENRFVPARPYKYLGKKKEVGYIRFLTQKKHWHGHNMLKPLPANVKKGDVFNVRIRELPNWETRKPREVRKIGSSSFSYKHKAFVIVPEGGKPYQGVAALYFIGGILCFIGAFFASPPSQYRTRFSKLYYIGWFLVYASWAVLVCSWANIYNIHDSILVGSCVIAFICYLTTLKEMMDKKTTMSDEHMGARSGRIGRSFDYTLHIGTMFAHMFFVYMVIYNPPL